jgi:hypothetical protein
MILEALARRPKKEECLYRGLETPLRVLPFLCVVPVSPFSVIKVIGLQNSRSVGRSL